MDETHPKTTKADFIFEQLEQVGYRSRIVSVSHLNELQDEFERDQQPGLVSSEITKNYFDKIHFHLPENLPDATSIIVMAIPKPMVRITFELDGKQAALIMPPIYMRYWETFDEVEAVLSGILKPYRYHTEFAPLPMKLLAARSGLAGYGKNNITFVEGLGSFHQIATYYSDLPCEQDAWQEYRMMERCKNCSACLKRCPTGAIVREMFLIHAERCIAFHNERPGDIPFPSWVDPQWHNSLIGCMRCQEICPMNRPYLDQVIEGAYFTEGETSLFLKGVCMEDLPPVTQGKIQQWGLEDKLSRLPRNLIALRNKQMRDIDKEGDR